MGIRDAIRALEEVQRGISIEEPIPIGVEFVYQYVPDSNQVLVANPCFINTWTLQPVSRMPNLRETQFDIRMQFAYNHMQQSVACDIVTAFMDAIINAFDKNTRLNGTISHHDLSGGSPTLVGFTWGDLFYIGLDLHLTAYIKDVAVYG